MDKLTWILNYHIDDFIVCVCVCVFLFIFFKFLCTQLEDEPSRCLRNLYEARDLQIKTIIGILLLDSNRRCISEKKKEMHGMFEYEKHLSLVNSARTHTLWRIYAQP